MKLSRQSIIIALLTLTALSCTPKVNTTNKIEQAISVKRSKPQKTNATSKIEQVIWVERPKPQVSFLYLVVTSTADDYDDIVIQNATKALVEAKQYEGKDFNIVFFIRTDPNSTGGMSTGFGIVQMEEIAALSYKQAKDKAMRHAWVLSRLPERTGGITKK